MNPDFIPVDDWEPERDEDYRIRIDGKLVIIPFDEIFDNPKAQTLNTFVIKRVAYVQKLPELAQYINYFSKFYDPDNELMTSYLMIKYNIDNKKEVMKRKAFVDLLYSILMTDSMKEKIRQMVEDNYYVELENKKDSQKKFAESLEFTNHHAKIMMMISMAMKIMVPLILHYTNRTNAHKDEEEMTTGEHPSFFPYYKQLMYLFDPSVDIYNKLRVTVNAKIKRHIHRGNSTTWAQREILGIDPLIYGNKLLKVNLISETMFKYRFFKNIVSFNSVILDKQLNFFSATKFTHTMRELTTRKDAEGLSGIDKLEINSAKIDESLVILSDVNIKATIKKLKKSFNIKLEKEEIDYYMKHYKRNKFQIELVEYFYAKYFGGYRDLKMIRHREYVKLMVLLKKRLQYQGAIYLPQLITGNIDRLIKRNILNQKFLDKLESSSVYQTIIKEKFDTLEEVGKKMLINSMLSTLINTSPSMKLVDYEQPDKLGEMIDVAVPDILSDEFLHYLNQI